MGKLKAVDARLGSSVVMKPHSLVLLELHQGLVHPFGGKALLLRSDKRPSLDPSDDA